MINIYKKQNKINNKGFTLVELMVAVTLFISVAFVSLGAVVSVFSANKRVQNMKSIIDNLNFAVEDMARTVRFGSTYHCGTGGNTNLTVTQDCTGGDSTHTLLAVNFNSQTVVYRLNGTVLQKSTDGGLNYSNISPPEVSIRHLRFYTYGSSSYGSGDRFQPYVVVVLEGFVGNLPTPQSVFSIQTTLSQRSVDI